MTLESASEARLRTAVEAAGGMCVKIAPVDAGAPDRMVLYQGQIHLVELKQSGGRLRPVQRAWHSRAAADTDYITLATAARDFLDVIRAN